MCGIAGTVSFSTTFVLPDENRDAFVAPLKFRGPDDAGAWDFSSDEVRVSLFHRRLSIIDLHETGHQPMHLDGENLTIVFNGEIYNYRNLRQRLEEDGADFRSASDTEVLLHGYRHWGIEGLLEKIDGMFAFALFDKNSRSLFLARDRFGKKPLYYSVFNGTLVFSSDIRSFHQLPSLSLSVDLHSLGYFFAEQSTPREHSIWREVKKVPSAHFAVFSDKEFTIEKYWTLHFSTSNISSWPEIVEQTEVLLKQAVNKRLVADVPVSALLSGGIDSSLVVAMMAQLQPAVRTYTVTFDVAHLDESKYAKIVANLFSTNHTEIQLSQMDEAVIDSVICEAGEPFADASILPTYLISREIAKTEKVVCGGDGGDELFGGYYVNYFAEKLLQVRKWKKLEFAAAIVRRVLPSYRSRMLYELLKAANAPDYEILNRKISFLPEEVMELGLPAEACTALKKEHEKVWAESTATNLGLSKQLLETYLHTRLENDYLVKVDRASMFASLEMRSPFLDKDLSQFAATIKEKDLYSRYGPKSVLKGVAEKYFPKDFVHRHKMGFGVPIEKWFRKDLVAKFRDTVLSQRQSLVPLNYKYIEQLLQRHRKGENHAEKLWTLYVFHVWAGGIKRTT